MKLEKVILKNFRSYQEETTVQLDELTTLIGKNDIGKSTILEALEIFFNNSIVKIGQDDLCVTAESKAVTIGCIFSDFPENIIIDASYRTNLDEEYLLNEESLLEVHKVFDCSKKNPTSEVFIKALHPKMDEKKFLVQLTQTELKKRVKELDIDESQIGDSRLNANYRKAIFEHYSDSKLELQMISLSKGDSKSIWEKLKLEMPIYSLFQSDRPSSDGDSEVQDPMKLAVKEALANAEKELIEIKEKVERQTLQVAKATLEKLREMDENLGNSLIPLFTEEPKWSSIFKFSLEDESGIPINKRGSGVRRLILLNFFRAAAERKTDEQNRRDIIYAIEEPETAQHPNNQRMLAEAFKELSQNENTQVILTTHVPSFASLLPADSIRFIDNINGEKLIKSTRDDEQVIIDVVDALGVIPSPVDSSKVKVAVIVEGPNDVAALKILSHIIAQENKDIVDLRDSEEIIFIISGGSTLKYWVQNQYLKTLGIPELHLVDRDEKVPPSYEKWCNQVNSRGDGSKAFMTRKREMENYIHPRAIKEHFKLKEELNLNDMSDIPKIIGELVGMKSNTVKKHLNEEVISLMTYEEIKEMDCYNEIEDLWLKELSAFLSPELLLK